MQAVDQSRIHHKSLVYTPAAKYGGVEIFSINLFNGLLALGVNAWIYCPKTGPLLEELSDKAKQRLITGDFDALVNFIKNNDIEKIYLPSQGIEQGTVLLKHIFPNLEVIVTCHATIPEGWSYQSADVFISCSHWLANLTSKFLNYNTSAIHNGIDSSIFSFREENTTQKPIILWAGRTSDPIKNFSLFIDIIAELDPNDADILVVSPNQQSLLTKHQQVTLESFNYQWCHSTYHEMPSIYNRVANSNGFLVITSKREGFGLVAAEAQCCGCPVVSPNHTGIKEAAIQAQLRFDIFNTSRRAAVSILHSLLKNSLHHIRGKELACEAERLFSHLDMANKYIFTHSDMDVPKNNCDFVSYLKRLKYNGLHKRFLLALAIIKNHKLKIKNYKHLILFVIKG